MNFSWLAKVPRFARVIIPLQTILNLLLALWIYEEYTHNRYFGEYVSSSLQGGVSAAVFFVSTGLLVIVAVGLYAKLQAYRRELRGMASRETLRPMEEGLVKRSIRELKEILSRLAGKLRRSR